MEEYEELAVLAGYVFHNCHSLLTLEERRVEKARIARRKASHTGGKVSELIEERWGLVGDPEVNSQLADDGVGFRTRVCQRVLTDLKEKIVVNRCPDCDKVVRTPLAKQCLWRGHDWH